MNAMITSPRVPYLFDAPGPTLAEHTATWGALPTTVHAGRLAEAVELTGRGGAGFPTAAKIRSVAEAAARAGRAPVVVGNGAEGEPAAAKDAVLLGRAPHLVLDGLSLVARTLGAAEVFLAAEATSLSGVQRSLAERHDGLPLQVHTTTPAFLAGEESALVSAIDGGAALPLAKDPPVRHRGVARRPTLVLNVETLARFALVARGHLDAAERTLVTRRRVRGGLPAVDVVDVSRDQRLGELLDLGADVQAVLVGGYHGTWLTAAVAGGLPLTQDGLAGFGASLGAGVLAALPANRCGLQETARVVGYLAGESAGQCGPCLNGLPRIAAALAVLARPAPPPPTLLADVHRWCGLVTGRGACRHPDGSVRLVTSALTVFGDELRAHEHGRCTATDRHPFLPTPGAGS
jgi:NADH:ubiquinone oxidoreductase subunit F (NADH-binding)